MLAWLTVASSVRGSVLIDRRAMLVVVDVQGETASRPAPPRRAAGRRAKYAAAAQRLGARFEALDPSALGRVRGVGDRLVAEARSTCWW